MIGLYDWDLITWKQATVFNLDLMRYSGYLKGQRKIVQIVENLQDERVTEWHIFKEYEDNVYPAHLVEDPRVHFHGRAIGYSESDADWKKANVDVDIYRKMRRYYNTNRQLDYFNKQLNALHTQLGDDNGNINPKWCKDRGKQRVVIFHDRDISSYPDTVSVLEKHLKENPITFFGFKYPILIQDEEQLTQWLKLPLSRNLRNLELSFVPTAEKYLVSRPNLADYTFSVEGLSLDKLFLFSLLLLQRGNNVMWTDHDVLSQYFAYYIREKNRTPITFYEYVKYRQTSMSKREKVALFQHYKSEQSALFDLFFSTEYVEYNEGKLIPKMYTMRERRERR